MSNSRYKANYHGDPNDSVEGPTFIMSCQRNIFADKAYDPPLHLQPVMRKIFGTFKGQLPKSEKILCSSICLPSHQDMTNEDADYVCKNFLEILETI